VECDAVSGVVIDTSKDCGAFVFRGEWSDHLSLKMASHILKRRVSYTSDTAIHPRGPEFSLQNFPGLFLSSWKYML
jgi:hypothetical protein